MFYFTKKGKGKMTSHSHPLTNYKLLEYKIKTKSKQSSGDKNLVSQSWKNLLQSLRCINIVSLIFNVESDQKKLSWHKKSPGPWIYHNIRLSSQPNQVMRWDDENYLGLPALEVTKWDLSVLSPEPTLPPPVACANHYSLSLRDKDFSHIEPNVCLF